MSKETRGIIMIVEITNHARRKIKQRNLREDWVRKTVEKPDFVRKSYGNRQLAYRRIGKLYLKVVFVQEGQTIVVLTSHFEKGVKLSSWKFTTTPKPTR